MAYSAHEPSPIRVLVAPSGAGELSAEDVAKHLGEGVRSVILNAEISLAPMSTPAPRLAPLFRGERITLPTTDAAGRLTEATYTFDQTAATAYIDAADVTGTEAFTPGESDSYGIGVLAADAQSRGARRIVLGLDGAVTDDGGVGILVAFGIHPLNSAGHTLPKGANALEELADFDTAKLNAGAAAMEWVMVTDTDAGLANNAAGMARLAEVTGVDPQTPGIGSGGGMAMALSWISSLIHGSAQVSLVSPEQLVAHTADTSEITQDQALVITAGAARRAFAADSTNDADVLGLAGETILQADLDAAGTENAAAAYERAGASIAADYLRISTVQG
ncbi:glycerate kinase [Corynebacterium yudongzhengii]|uniref:Glycerate kinase n=1 Tax=Corynebacterium yudongzhengii TaxID=2080740 RepID=A0A2U1T6L8_9CORY|nr:glycerate kinase [Corynebacterium yudongzhengii]AWB81630.1 glycerate kinase [Corynebacterium yudongzhengii]PWC01615.1 glycerate kinase [Corynebacterium yudongzhengii]